MIGLSVLSFRLVKIQLVDRQRYAESSRKTYHRTEKLPAIRGMIVDRQEEPMARSIPVATVFVDKNHLNDPKLASYGLAYQQATREPGWEQLSATERRRRIHGLRGEILELETKDVIVQRHLEYAVGILARPLGMRREELRKKLKRVAASGLPSQRNCRKTWQINCAKPSARITFTASNLKIQSSVGTPLPI